MIRRNSLNDSNRFINIWLIAFVFLIIAIGAYVYFGTKKMRLGPIIQMATPEHGLVVTSPIIEIEGKVENVNRIFINNKQVPVRDGNTLKEKLLLAPGENTFVITAYDELNNTNRQIIKIIYKQ